jgi:hypothetical protein
MRRLDPYAYLALALFIIWDFGRRLFEWVMTGQLRVWSLWNADHFVIFSQEPVYFMFGFVMMSVLVAIGLFSIAALIVEPG